MICIKMTKCWQRWHPAPFFLLFYVFYLTNNVYIFFYIIDIPYNRRNFIHYRPHNCIIFIYLHKWLLTTHNALCIHNMTYARSTRIICRMMQFCFENGSCESHVSLFGIRHYSPLTNYSRANLHFSHYTVHAHSHITHTIGTYNMYE